MRIIALDIGSKRTGVAVSDASGSIATPLKVLPPSDIMNNARTFRRILEDYEPDMLVFGLPVSMDGTEHAQAYAIRETAYTIADQYNIPYEFVDERLSSNEAKRIMHNDGLDERAMRGKIDMVAASLFLQAYLDAQKASEGDDEDVDENVDKCAEDAEDADADVYDDVHGSDGIDDYGEDAAEADAARSDDA
jgi:putative Holliday junction resolvase